jgi:hypothetical protein
VRTLRRFSKINVFPSFISLNYFRKNWKETGTENIENTENFNPSQTGGQLQTVTPNFNMVDDAIYLLFLYNSLLFYAIVNVVTRGRRWGGGVSLQRRTFLS